jgi:hypothetical protein
MVPTAKPIPNPTAGNPACPWCWIPVSLRMCVAIVVILGAGSALRIGVPADRQRVQPVDQIITLTRDIQGKEPDKIRELIIERFGPAQRDIGSGRRIEQWEIYDGVLTFSLGNGPTFFDPKTKKSIRLLRTTNPVRSSLLRGYEMYTLPDPANHGTCFWLGNVKFAADLTYEFTDSGENRDHRSAQKENFFMLRPAGKVEVRYVAPIMPDTLLESVPEGAKIANLVFTSSDGKHEATFSITSSEQLRCLRFGADKPLSFRMDTGWKSFWR